MPYWVYLTKNALFGYFGAKIKKKTIVTFKVDTLKFVKLQNFAKKTNKSKFVTKNALQSTFDQGCLIWVFLGKN